MAASEGLYIERGGVLVNMVARPYASEALLQDLLEQHSVLLAGDQITPGQEARRFVLVRREAGIPDAVQAPDRWSIDHLFLDQDGVPTLVEVKRSSDTRIRREVAGQMLDYAANAVVYWPADRLAADLDATHEERGGGFEALRSLLELEEADLELAEQRIASYWQQVASNLDAGRVRLLFVADELPDELRRIIEFLNQQMAPADVLGIEIRNYEGGDLRALVPRVVGLTEAAKEHKRQGADAGPTIDELWAQASPAVLQLRSLLDALAGELGLEARDLKKSRRYAWPSATRAAFYLYPDPYNGLYVSLSEVADETQRELLRQTLSGFAGRDLSRSEPGVAASLVVSRYADLREQFLVPFIEAVRGEIGSA